MAAARLPPRAAALIAPRGARSRAAAHAAALLSASAEDVAIRPPKTLSPTSCNDWNQCPRLYKLRHIERRKTPSSSALERGIASHTALENLFSLERAERTPDRLAALFREAWAERRHAKPELLDELFGGGDADADADAAARARLIAERAWGLESLEKLGGYFALEEPGAFDPLAREERMRVEFEDEDNARDGGGGGGGGAAPLVVTGVLDRIDEDPTSGRLTIVDYKTSKPPHGATGPGANAKAKSYGAKARNWSAAMHRRTGGVVRRGGPNRSTPPHSFPAPC